MELRNGSAINYLLKYLRKTEERVIYSRGIATEIVKRLDNSMFAATMGGDYVSKYVIFDGVIDWKRDILSPAMRRMRTQLAA